MTTAIANSIRDEARDLLAQLGVDESAYTNGELIARTPITGDVVASSMPSQPGTYLR